MWQRRVITDKEAANDLITVLVEDFSIPELPVVIQQIAADLKLVLFNRLIALRSTGFEWYPCLVGPGLNEAKQQQFRAELKKRFVGFESLFD